MRTRTLRAALALSGLVAAAGLSGLGTADAASAACPWLDPHQSPDARAAQLVRAMTLDEKVGMLHSAERTGYTYYSAAGHVAGIPRLCVPELVLNDAGSGVGNQKVGVTAFPVGISQAASWDRGLQQDFGRVLGEEASRKGVNVQLAPGINIARVPQNGRTFEYAGEDPVLSGQVGASIVQGIQSQHVIATVKHYAVNNQETDRMTVSADVDERTLHEVYLPAFETTVRQGGVGAVMCSYNRVNGVHACENPTLLNTDLKGRFGFSGWVMSDWEATHSTVAAAEGGLDMEMAAATNGTYYGDALKAAVLAHRVPMSRLDDMVRRITRTMFRVGLFEHPASPAAQGFVAPVDTEEHVAEARKVSEDGTVLLKNSGVLPLTRRGTRIALVGTAANPVGANLVDSGGGSSKVLSAKVVSPLEGITRRAAADGSTVVYADGTATADAVAAAKTADVAVVFANDTASEGADKSSLSLDQGPCTLAGCAPVGVDQDALIAAVAAANPRTVVVLNTGGPVLMPWLSQVSAVLEAWYPGQEDGNAIAALLFGDVDPSGKLPQTFPKRVQDLPATTAEQWPGVGGHATYSERLEVGYRWFDAHGITPLFPFGHGLSYTRFRYGPATVRRTASGADVSFDLTNTGGRAGAEVAQVYVAPPASAGEPPKALAGYEKVPLRPGETRRVTVHVPERSFQHWSTAAHGWVTSAGRTGVLVGASSRDLRSRTSLLVR
ncbi:MAG: glycosyl hydrolase [Frankiales bacterium]|nr:glycosyl hydrolase [Frankiales bacterium]